jgi:hypothetical protein
LIISSFIVSENKVLCHPSSVDSISTSAGQEDHVSMGGWSARKALKVIDNVEIRKELKIFYYTYFYYLIFSIGNRTIDGLSSN